MYIKSISLHNFRNFKETTINLTNGFQTIIGENNIGKSNLLYGIRLVLDKELSYRSRYLQTNDFYGFPDIDFNSYIMISIEFYGDKLDELPCFHALKTDKDTARCTYFFAHESKLYPFLKDQNEYPICKIEDFKWKLCGGEEVTLNNIGEREKLNFNDLEGLDLYYLSDFRNIYKELMGSNSSLLSEFCKILDNKNEYLENLKEILIKASDDLNKQPFIPEIAKTIKTEEESIAGKYFSTPISLGFLSDFDEEVWNELNLFFQPFSDKKIPIEKLGLGQKNILYLTLFLAILNNKKDPNIFTIVLIEEPEAHLHPQLQKVLFRNIGKMDSTQVIMNSHSTHIASDCDFKNICILYKLEKTTQAFSPLILKNLNTLEINLLKRYLDATRSEIFFASAVILIEGIAEQFIVPAIAKNVYGIDFTEYNISIVPIYGRHFSAFMKLFQNGGLEIPLVVLIDGDEKEIINGEKESNAVKKLEDFIIEGRVHVFTGKDTLEVDLFPYGINTDYLKKCFIELGHEKSFNNLNKCNNDKWNNELLSRIENTITKGLFAQQLSTLIDDKFLVPKYIEKCIKFIARSRKIKLND